MASNTKRKKIVLSVTSSTLVVGLICIYLLATAISGSPSPETSTIQPSNTPSQSTITESAKHSTVTTSPIRTTPTIHSNPPYDVNYSTSQKPRTPSVTTPTPTVVTPPPHEDAIIEISNIELVEFNDQIAKYKIYLQSNQSGKVRIVATNNDQELTTRDITAEYIRSTVFTDKDYSLLATQQNVSTAEGSININEKTSFEITVSIAKFDLFIIIDGNSESEYMKIPKPSFGNGGVPTVDTDNSRVEVKNDTDQILCRIPTTLDAEVIIKFYKPNGVASGKYTENTANCVADFVIARASQYEGCKMKITLKYKNITGTGEWILIESLSINNDD